MNAGATGVLTTFYHLLPHYTLVEGKIQASVTFLQVPLLSYKADIETDSGYWQTDLQAGFVVS